MEIGASKRDPPPRSPSPERGGGCLVSARILFSYMNFADIHVILHISNRDLPPALPP